MLQINLFFRDILIFSMHLRCFMNCSPGSILIVDDTRLNLEIMKSLLQNDYTIFTASDGQTGLALAQTEKIDLVLLDINMPEMDGYEVCARLKSDPATENIPVIFVTARDDVAEETKGLALGAIDYMIKPISAPVVKARVRNHMRLKQYHDRLYQSDIKVRQLSAAVEQSPVSVVIMDTDRLIVYVNPMFCEMTGHAAEALLNQNSRFLQSPLTPPSIYAEVWQNLTAGQTWCGEFCNQKKNGELYWESVSIKPLLDNAGQITHYVGVITDITLRKQTETKLRELSLTDELTGLSNRRGFTILAEQQIKLSQRLQQGFFLFFADMDCMKGINDIFGHAIGDQALQELAKLLKESFRASDIVARLGGDEFVCLSVETGPAEIAATLTLLQHNIAEANRTLSRPYTLSLSIGTAQFDSARPSDLDTLLVEADRQMYIAKNAKKRQQHLD